jgi:hypothetical protein
LAADVELFDDWDSVARSARGALDARALLFERLAWFRLLAEHCPPAGHLLAAHAGSSWLFLAREGGHARAYANWYSLRVGPIGGSEGLAPIANALRRAGLASITMAPVADPGPFEAALRKAGWRVFRSQATISWQSVTEGLAFADYWARRPSRVRNTAERRARALSIEIHRQFDPLAWAAYEEIYAASWKPSEGSPDFLRALAEHEGGRLRLGIARHEGVAVAAQMWLVENGVATIHKLAYREEARHLSPGTVLSMAMFRAALDEDGVRRIDYGTGDEPYKADWTDERHVLWRVEAFNPGTFSGLAGAARRAASTLVRRAARR